MGMMGSLGSTSPMRPAGVSPQQLRPVSSSIRPQTSISSQSAATQVSNSLREISVLCTSLYYLVVEVQVAVKILRLFVSSSFTLAEFSRPWHVESSVSRISAVPITYYYLSKSKDTDSAMVIFRSTGEAPFADTVIETSN